MPKTKKTVKEVKQDAEKAVAELEQKAEKTAEEVKTAVEKETAEVKKTVKTAQQKAAKETAKVKASAKRAVAKAKAGEAIPVVYVQYQDAEEKVEDLVAAATAAFRAEHSRTHISDLKLYIKPEERAAYYVVNDRFAGRVDF